MELERGQVAVVTGSGSGIGLAMAHAFARQGLSVVLADVQADALDAAAAAVSEHGVEAMTAQVDVSKQEQVEALATSVVERFGRVDVVCNNAGVAGAGGDPWTDPLSSWEWVMGVNFWGVVHGVRAFLPHLVMNGGHIVNTASIAGLYPGFAAPYDASKHAVVALTEGLFNSMQAAALPVGVSCLCPGFVRTAIMDSDRNWPAELGERPASNAATDVSLKYIRRAVDEGMTPGAVADLVVGAIRDQRYWVFPHPDFIEIAVDRFHRIAESLDPAPPDEMPGLPPRAEMMAEMMAATGATPPA